VLVLTWAASSVPLLDLVTPAENFLALMLEQ